MSILFGLSLTAGMLLVVSGWRASRPEPPLVAALHRVPGYFPERSPVSAPELLWRSLRPVGESVLRLAGGRGAVERRLVAAGRSGDGDRFLLDQVLHGAAGAVVGVGLVMLGGDHIGPPRVGMAVAVGALLGLLLGDYRLTRQVGARAESIAEEFPVAAELLALLMAAGVPTVEAVGRVGRAVGGELGAEMVRAAADVSGGASMAAALRSMARRTGVVSLDRFVQGLLSAVERGTPLAEVARAQAIDARAQAHRDLMVAAGRKDIAMLVPVVFAVLPTVVIVALLPGAVQLGLIG